MEEELRLGESQGHKTSLCVDFPISLILEHSIPCFLPAFQATERCGDLGIHAQCLICTSSPHSASRPKAQQGTGHRGSRGGEGKGLQAEPRGEFGLARPLQSRRILTWGLGGACHVLELARVLCSVSHTR